ncbi:Chromosomal replication initiator protein DnaA OS=Rhodanobacter lindaniclasticus OX=75310 GN=dnaA PE=3 SV=1 [Rhodanobacter lindaniclasticus]
MIEPPDFETRAAISVIKAHDKSVAMDESVAMLLAKRIRSNVRDLEGALNTLAARANFYGRPITTEFANKTLRDLLATHAQAITIANIQKITAEYFNVRLEDLLSKRRVRSLARPRQIAMTLSEELTKHSLPRSARRSAGGLLLRRMHACVRSASSSRPTCGCARTGSS